MLLTSGFRLPYADPDGYEIVAPQHLQLLAERVDSILGGFDTRSSTLLKRPTLARTMSAAQASVFGSDWIYFDTVAFDTSAGGLQLSPGTSNWRVNPAGPLSADCYVMFGFTGDLTPEGVVKANTFRDWEVRVIDYSPGTPAGGLQVLRNHARNYETGTGAENATVCSVVRLKPNWELQAGIRHGNNAGGQGSNMRYGPNGVAWMTYLMAVA